MTETPTLGSIISLVQSEIELPRNELNILLGWVLGMDRVALIREADRPLPMDKVADLKAAARRRLDGEPIAYITGHQEFFSRPFQVDNRVLIPRPETEELVERALGFIAPHANANLLTRVLDMGTGSGAIAISLALENPILQIWASDVSADCLKVAKANAKALHAKHVQFVQSDLFDAFETLDPSPQFDLIVSNPPYIPAGDPHLFRGDLRFEPDDALCDRADGLSFYRALAHQSRPWLRPNGGIMVEHGFDQQGDVMQIFKAAGFLHVEGFNDLAGHPRIVLAQVLMDRNASSS